MLTANLIRDIDEGVAQVKTFVWGVSGAGRLPVPKNSRVVITDLYINPFINENPAAGITLLDAHRTMQYTFTSNKSRNEIILRHQFQLVIANLTPNQVQMQEAVHIETYWVHSDEVRLNCNEVTQVAGWIAPTFLPLDDASREPAPPLGYGTITNGGLNVVKTVEMGAGSSQYIAVGRQNQPSTVLTAGYTDQFHQEVKAIGALRDPTTLGGNNCYPIVNIFYVLYENVMNAHVKGS